MDIEKIRRDLEKLAENARDDDERTLYEFFSNLFSIQERYVRRALEEIEKLEETSGYRDAASNLSEVPLIEERGFPKLEDGFWRDLSLDLLNLVAETWEEWIEPSRKMREYVESGRVNIAQLSEDLFEGEDLEALAGEKGLNPDLLKAIVTWSSQTVLGALSEHVRDYLNLDGWYQGYCPVCGSYTRIGFMVGEGRKLWLRCMICGTEWPFVRIKCPFCGNEDHKTLGFYTIEGESKFRLYFCQKCGSYYKVVDETILRDEEKVSRELYDLITRELDQVAEELGLS